MTKKKTKTTLAPTTSAAKTASKNTKQKQQHNTSNNTTRNTSKNTTRKSRKNTIRNTSNNTTKCHVSCEFLHHTTSKSPFCARLPSIFSTYHQMPSLPRNVHFGTTSRSADNAIRKKTRNRKLRDIANLLQMKGNERKMEGK